MRASGIVLIVITGLLTFHPPHFLLEANRFAGGSALELGLAINLLAAVIAAVGIARDARWGWLLGLVIAVVAVGLYVVQQTLGLPGLPQDPVEPSRIAALAIEALFITVALRRLRDGRRAAAVRRRGLPRS